MSGLGGTEAYDRESNRLGSLVKMRRDYARPSESPMTEWVSNEQPSWTVHLLSRYLDVRNCASEALHVES